MQRFVKGYFAHNYISIFLSNIDNLLKVEWFQVFIFNSNNNVVESTFYI